MRTPNPIIQLVYAIRGEFFELSAVVKRDGNTYEPYLEQGKNGEKVIMLPGKPHLNPSATAYRKFYYCDDGLNTCCYAKIETTLEEFKFEMPGCGTKVAAINIDKFLFVDMSPEQRKELEERGWTFKASIYDGRLVFLPEKTFLVGHRIEQRHFRPMLGKMFGSEYKLDYCFPHKGDALNTVMVHTYTQAKLVELLEQHINTIGLIAPVYMIPERARYKHKFYADLPNRNVELVNTEDLETFKYWWIKLCANGQTSKADGLFDAEKLFQDFRNSEAVRS
jgi:hypothetical protein